ncbi:MAG TPA: ABC transporter substrate-binding protein, partial [Clostridiales bacterium]|nr:ABC transporter substrate-binding protein [Clostridiales bacterium]
MDWLKKAKLDPPTTISEWETALTAFRKQQDCPAPFTGSLDHLKRVFIPAFEIGQDFYPDGKAIKYGPAEDGYKE